MLMGRPVRHAPDPGWKPVSNRRDRRRTRLPHERRAARFRRQRATRMWPCDKHGRPTDGAV
jgi:hypothetical protein